MSFGYLNPFAHTSIVDIMANPLGSVGAKVKTFAHSSDMDALAGAFGALVGVAAVPYTPQLTFLGAWAKVSNVLYGLGLIILGAWIKHDGLGYFLIGAGLAYLVDGLVRVFIPSVTSSASYAPIAALNAAAPLQQGTYQGQVLYNG